MQEIATTERELREGTVYPAVTAGRAGAVSKGDKCSVMTGTWSALER